MVTRYIFPNDIEHPHDISDIVRSRIFWGVIFPLSLMMLIVMALFTPLALSLAENHFLGTDYIYEAFQAVDLADPLGKLYIPFLERFPFLNP